VDELMEKCGMMFDGLDTLFTYPLVGEMVSEALRKEVESALQKQGDFFEQSSVFSGLLSTTLLIAKLNPFVLALDKYSCFKSLRNFPNVTTIDAENCFMYGATGY
jgi:hypothetical protein